MRLANPPLVVLAATPVWLTGCAHIERVEATDLVVIGQVQTTGSEVMDEWGLNVKFDGRLKITRVLKGTAPADELPVRYIAHSEYASDGELEFRLRRAEGGTWLICRRGGGRGYICDCSSCPLSWP